MTEADQQAFGELIADAHAYWRKDLSDFTLSLWWEACQPYTLEQVRRAIGQHARKPQAGRFVVTIADVTEILDGNGTERAVMVWGQVGEAMRRVGAYRDIDFGDPAIHQAIADCGGWPALCRTPLDELRHVQHRFQQAYQAYESRGVPDTAPLQLAGDRSPDEMYEQRGLPLPKPARIGAARLVRQHVIEAPAPLQLEA